jgi:hypothetical protein
MTGHCCGGGLLDSQAPNMAAATPQVTMPMPRAARRARGWVPIAGTLPQLPLGREIAAEAWYNHTP